MDHMDESRRDLEGRDCNWDHAEEDLIPVDRTRGAGEDRAADDAAVDLGLEEEPGRAAGTELGLANMVEGGFESPERVHYNTLPDVEPARDRDPERLG